MKLRAWHVLFGVLLIVHVLSWRADFFYPFSDLYWLVMSVSLIFFILGYWPGAWLFLKVGGGRLLRMFTKLKLSSQRGHRVFQAMFWLFFLLGLLDRFLMFGPSFFLPDTVMQYRISMTMEDGENIIKGLSLGNFFLFMMPSYLIAYRNKFNAFNVVLIIVAVLFNIYLSSARSVLFVSALSAFYFWILPQRINFSAIIRIGVVVSILFFGFELIGIVVGKSNSELGFVVYAAAPLHAFDAILGGQSTLDGYLLSFSPIHSILANFINFIPPISLPNVFTPLPTNVYTMFGVYYVDYGVFGLFVMMFLIGLLSGALQKVCVPGQGLFRVWSAINMTVLTLSVFYDYYTTSGVIWMSIILSPFFFSRCEDEGDEVQFPRSQMPSLIK